MRDTITPDFNMENHLRDQKPWTYQQSKASTMKNNRVLPNLSLFILLGLLI